MKTKFNTLFENICKQKKKHIVKESMDWTEEQIEQVFKEQMIDACDYKELLFKSEQQKQQFIDDAWNNYGDDIIAYIEGDPTAEQELDQMVRNAIMANSESIFDEPWDYGGVDESVKTTKHNKVIKEDAFSDTYKQQYNNVGNQIIFDKIRDEILIFDLGPILDRYTQALRRPYGRGDYIDALDKIIARGDINDFYEFVDKSCMLVIRSSRNPNRDKVSYFKTLRNKLQSYYKNNRI